MPVVAIVGRPNVGKSTLFNKIAGERISIVDDKPGVTRDRIYAQGEWTGHTFSLIDTGGLEPKNDEEILKNMREQAMVAIEAADVIVMITNVAEGVTAADEDVAHLLMRAGKPIVLAVNKVDNPNNMDVFEFYNLGLGEPMPVSSVHGLGIGDLLDRVVEHFQEEAPEEEEDDVIKVAVIGKPNAGKSSLINHILGEKRVIVSDIPGTTRDAIDSPVERGGVKYNFIDTAGMRRKAKVNETIERYSVIRSLAAVDRSNVCVVMVDATEGVTEQDAKIAGYAHEQGKACVIAVNKWDLVKKETKTMNNYKLDVRDGLSFMQYAPIVFISALSGQRVDQLFEQIQFVNDQNARRIPTGMLNDVLNEAVMKVQPPSDKGKRLKVYYITQAGTRPPTFVVFVNKKELMHFSYLRYIENQIRTAFGLEGTPVRFVVRERGEKGNQ